MSRPPKSPAWSDPEALAAAITGNLAAAARAAVPRAITLMESTRPDHRSAARELYALLSPHAGKAWRVGISGPPGAGKSTLIENLGGRLTGEGLRIGVLTIDPSSVRTGGSLLGDKTRMPTLSTNPLAYIRPSPNSGTLGGVTRATAQALTVLDAAGYDVLLVETVGVGQSETAVAAMVDVFALLTLPRTGDQLQGIKKGVLELADLIAVNKADGDSVLEAKAAARELTGAIRIVHGHGPLPPVLTCSGQTGAGVEEFWRAVTDARNTLGEQGLASKRAAQRVELTWALVRDEIEQRLRRSAHIAAIREDLVTSVLADRLSAPAAADLLLAAFDRDIAEDRRRAAQ